MLLRWFVWVQESLFLLSGGWEVWTTTVPSPTWSNQKDVQAVKQLMSRGQLPLGVDHHLDITMLKGGRLSAKTWLMYWYSNKMQVGFFSFQICSVFVLL